MTKFTVRSAGIPFLLSALFWGTACTVVAPDEAPPKAYSLADCGPRASADLSSGEDGPFQVGYRSWDVTYDAPAGVGKRTIKLNVWYPTQAPTSEHPRYLGLFPDKQSFVDAKPAAPLSPCGFPLIAYSHGHMGLAGGAAYLMRKMASHGWVAVGPDHTLNTIADNQDPRPNWLNLVRASDISASVDALRDLPAGDVLSATIATDRYVLFGHSYGTFTAWIAAGAAFEPALVEERCAQDADPCDAKLIQAYAQSKGDPRIVAIVPMAGGYQESWFGEQGFKNVKVPILQMSGSNDPVGAVETWPLFNGIDITWIELEGGCHETFNLGACDTLDVDLGYDIVGTYGLAFARYQLLGDQSPSVTGIVDGQEIVSTKVAFKRKTP